MKTTNNLSAQFDGSIISGVLRSVSAIAIVCFSAVVMINVMMQGQASYITKVTETIIEASK